MASLAHQLEHYPLKLALILSVESIRRVGRKVRRCTQGSVRRIEIDEVAFPRRFHDGLEPEVFYLHGECRQCGGHPPEVLLVADPGVLVPAAGDVEKPTRVQAEKTVVAGAVEVDEHPGELGRVRLRPRVTTVRDGCARRVEDLVPDAIVVFLRRRGIARLEFPEMSDHRVRLVAQAEAATDQVGVDVGEPDPAVLQRAALGEVEEDGAAPEKRLVVRPELAGVELAKRGKELPLAAGPLQERTSAPIIADPLPAGTIRGRMDAGGELGSRAHGMVVPTTGDPSMGARSSFRCERARRIRPWIHCRSGSAPARAFETGTRGYGIDADANRGVHSSPSPVRNGTG